MNQEETNTLDRIYEAARREFLEKGYQEASLRNIVKQAGVTTGAFYGYCKSKKELFDDLVGKEYRTLLDMYRSILEDFQTLSPDSQKNDMQDYTKRGMSRMTDYIYDNITAFRLILCCSDGTEYEHLTHVLAEMDRNATHDFSKVMEENGAAINSVNPKLEHMLISGMFSAYFEMFIHDVPREDAGEYTDQLLNFYTAGWQKIMGF